MKQKWFLALLCIAVLGSAALITGCDRRSDRGANTDTDVQIDVEVSPQPLAVGPAQVAVTLKDQAGQPIEEARVEVEGNMSHAGMTPVFAAAVGGEDGRYTTQDFEFTMGGDWFLIVRATLPDGRLVERTFDLKGVEGTAGGN